MAVPTILAFNLDAAALSALRGVCDDLGLRLKPVPAEGFSMPLGGMIGLRVTAPVSASSAAFDDPMLVMCGLSEEVFDAFLKALRCAALPPIPLKAVLTPVNAAWNALTLHDALSREHEAMLRQIRKKQQ